MSAPREHTLTLVEFNALVAAALHESGTVNRAVIPGVIVVGALRVNDHLRFYSKDRLISAVPVDGIRIVTDFPKGEVRVSTNTTRTTLGPKGELVAEQGNFVVLNFTAVTPTSEE